MDMQGTRSPADLIREARRRRGLSQERVALRAGTTQAAISRIERGEESPSWERARAILLVMGEALEPSVRPLQHDRDPRHLGMERERSPSERVEGAINSVRFANELQAAASATKQRAE